MFVMAEIEKFREFGSKLWLLLCDKFIELQSFNKWDGYIITLICNWDKSDFWNKNKSIYKLISFICQCIDDHFNENISKGFISSFIIHAQNAFIYESRSIIVRNLYSSKTVDDNVATDFHVFSFGGSGLQSVYKIILRKYSVQKKDLLPYIDVLTTKDINNDAIPERLRDENRGYMLIMDPLLAPFTKTILLCSNPSNNKEYICYTNCVRITFASS